MRSKIIIKGTMLIALLAVSVLVLYAQIDKRPAAKHEAEKQSNETTDTLPPVDNTEGLAELDRIMKRYEDGNIYLSGDINYYDASEANSAKEKTSFVSINTGSASLYEADSVQTIAAEGLVVMIDKKEKTMAIVERENKDVQPGAGSVIDAIKEFKEYIYSIQVSTSGSDKKISIEFTENSPANTQSYEVIYDAQTYRVKKVRMQIADGEITTDEENQKEEDELVMVDADNKEVSTGYYVPEIKVSVLEIVYKMEKKADASMIDIRKMVVQEADGYKPSDRYKHYELLN